MILVPLTADVPMHRLPWANWAILIGTVLLSIYVLLQPNHDLSDREAEQIADYYERTQPRDLKAINQYTRIELTRNDVKWTADQVRNDVTGPYTHPLALHPAAFRSWQLATHAGIHTGWIILLVNMLFLFCFGNAVNAKLGHIVFVLAYVAIAVVTGLIMLTAERPVPVLGSSGAIMGVLGIFLVLFPRNDVRFITGSGRVSGSMASVTSAPSGSSWAFFCWMPSGFGGTSFPGPCSWPMCWLCCWECSLK